MSRTQRSSLLGVAAVIAVLAIVVLPGNDDAQPRQSSQTQSTASQRDANTGDADTAGRTDTAGATPTRGPKPKPPLLRAGAERELTFTRGEPVRFRVRHPSDEEVHVHGYDITKDIRAGQSATIAFRATSEGIFEVELEHSGTPLGTIRVEPR
jgi:hypothetical protein